MIVKVVGSIDDFTLETIELQLLGVGAAERCRLIYEAGVLRPLLIWPGAAGALHLEKVAGRANPRQWTLERGLDAEAGLAGAARASKLVSRVDPCQDLLGANARGALDPRGSRRRAQLWVSNCATPLTADLRRAEERAIVNVCQEEFDGAEHCSEHERAPARDFGPIHADGRLGAAAAAHCRCAHVPPSKGPLLPLLAFETDFAPDLIIMPSVKRQAVAGGSEGALFCVMLELRDQVSLMREQLSDACAQVARLQERVAWMERSSETNRGLMPKTARPTVEGGGAPDEPQRVSSAPARKLRLDDLSSDLLACVITALPEDDRLAAALSCHKLRSAVSAVARDGTQRWASRPTKTTECSALSSLGKLKWAADCGLPLSGSLFAAAARRGELAQLSWLHEHGCALEPSVFAAAAQEGCMAALKWLHAARCPWDVEACAAASGAGKLAALRWLRANGCPWEEPECALAAAKGGHLDVLVWLRRQHAIDDDSGWDAAEVGVAAAAHGQLGVLNFMESPTPCSDGQVRGSSSLFNVFWPDKPVWVVADVQHASGRRWDEVAATAAARAGHLEALQWLHGLEGSRWSRSKALAAAKKCKRQPAGANIVAWVEAQRGSSADDGEEDDQVDDDDENEAM